MRYINLHLAYITLLCSNHECCRRSRHYTVSSNRHGRCSTHLATVYYYSSLMCVHVYTCKHRKCSQRAADDATNHFITLWRHQQQPTTRQSAHLWKYPSPAAVAVSLVATLTMSNISNYNKKLSWCWQTRATPWCRPEKFEDRMMCGRVIAHFQNGGRPPS